MKQRRVIGIVGGLGPRAHIDFERKLLEAAYALLGAERDQDFPEWVLSSIPQTPDRTGAYLGTDADPLPFLRRSIDRLERADAGFVVIACNTAHLFLELLADQLSLPIVSLIEVTAERAKQLAPGGTVGLLATTGTLVSRLYHDALESRGLRALSPLDLEAGDALQLRCVMEPIYGQWVSGAHRGGGIKTDGRSDETRVLLEEAAQRLIEDGDVDLLLAGCTEIPLVLDDPEIARRPLLDPASILAAEAIRFAYDI